jgi:hypothetical protein
MLAIATTSENTLSPNTYGMLTHKGEGDSPAC